MANENHVSQLKRGVESWNEWVRQNRIKSAQTTRHNGARIGVSSFWADLRGADLSGLDLYQGKHGAGHTGIDLIGVDLRDANLRDVMLAWANLTGATLSGADLRAATLSSARLHGVNLYNANLSGANIAGADFLMANLQRVNLTEANLYETIFSDTDLSGAVGLNACKFSGPCTIDHRTLFGYEALPETFLRGCGLPDQLIKYTSSMRREPIQFYSCFISYSSQDKEFAERLYVDLQANRIRCWFAPENLRIGDKMWDAIDRAVRLHDKLLLICSKTSVESEWVEDEVMKAFAEERERKTVVLFPIRIDNAVMETDEPWAIKIRNSRHIGDFCNWKDNITYCKAFERLTRDLRISTD